MYRTTCPSLDGRHQLTPTPTPTQRAGAARYPIRTFHYIAYRRPESQETWFGGAVFLPLSGWDAHSRTFVWGITTVKGERITRPDAEVAAIGWNQYHDLKLGEERVVRGVQGGCECMYELTLRPVLARIRPQARSPTAPPVEHLDLGLRHPRAHCPCAGDGRAEAHGAVDRSCPRQGRR